MLSLERPSTLPQGSRPRAHTGRPLGCAYQLPGTTSWSLLRGTSASSSSRLCQAGRSSASSPRMRDVILKDLRKKQQDQFAVSLVMKEFFGIDRVEDQSQFRRPFRGHRAPAADDIDGVVQPDQPRQSLRSAPGREESDLDLGQHDVHARYVDGDPFVHRQDQFGATAQTLSVDQRDDREGQFANRRKHIVSAGEALLDHLAHHVELAVDLVVVPPRIAPIPRRPSQVEAPRATGLRVLGVRQARRVGVG